MKRYIYFLFLAFVVASAQQQNMQLTRRQQKILKIQAGTTHSSEDAQRILKQEEDGWKCCAAGALTGLATTALWAALEHKELVCSYVACADPSMTALNVSCTCCGYITCLLCSVGCMAICNCEF